MEAAVVQGLKVVVAVRQVVLVVVLAVEAVAAMGAVMANWMEGNRSCHHSPQGNREAKGGG